MGENRALMALYFSMAFAVEQGKAYTKAHLIRERQGTEENPGPLFNRSRSSIECKLMNATAVVEALGFARWSMHEHGYRRLANYQADLKTAAVEYLRGIGVEVAA